MPPWALTYWKYAFADGAISLYPGAATPVSGWWLPIRISDFVMPGADAVSAPLDEVELPPLEPHAATVIATPAMTAAAPMYRRRDLRVLLMSCLPPGVRWPAAPAAAVPEQAAQATLDAR